MENTDLKKGEYLPSQTPINKIIAEIIISFFVIKIGEREKITPIMIWGTFLKISWLVFLFLYFKKSEIKSEKITNRIKIIISKKLFSWKKFFNIK